MNINQHNFIDRQRGVVLIVSLIFLIALTSIAGMLMQNTTMDVKMSSAGQEKTIATQDAISSVYEIIRNEKEKLGDGENGFLEYKENFPAGNDFSIDVPVSYDNTNANIQLDNENLLDVGCGPADIDDVSSDTPDCQTLKIRVNRTYGRTNNSSIDISAGIVQQLQQVSTR